MLNSVLKSDKKNEEAEPLARQLANEFFDVEKSDLKIGGVPASELASQYGTPYYAYDLDVMKARFHDLSNAVKGFAEIYYSVKANPRHEIASLFVKEGAGLEIASMGELKLALDAGCRPDRILFAGPGKGVEELDLAVKHDIGEIHLETFEEMDHLAALADKYGKKVKVAIRVNPQSDALGGAMRMGGKPTAFGFDEEILSQVLDQLKWHNSLELTGIHLFSGTQILSSQTLLKQWEYGLKLAAKLVEMTGKPLKTIDLGGGLGVPYHQKDGALDLHALAEAVPHLISIKQANPLLANAKVILEPGRFLTAPGGAYVVGVRAIKHSRGERFVITDGGMHHHLAASGNLGQVIKRDYPLVPANRMDDPEVHGASIVGPLCTPLDTIGRATPMPNLEQKDLVAVLQSGAYGVSASPVGFLSHEPPKEICVSNGKHSLMAQF